MSAKKLEPGSKWSHLDKDGDGKLSEDERKVARASFGGDGPRGKGKKCDKKKCDKKKEGSSSSSDKGFGA